MHKMEAANLFALLGDGDRVKTLKMLYMRDELSELALKMMVGSDDSKFDEDIKLLEEAELIIVKRGYETTYYPNKGKIDELMSFISTPCGCGK